MADLRGYLCWAPETASATINTEAINPSPAVFLATHTPLTIRRARIQGRSLVSMDGTVDEKAVLKDFLERRSDTGTLLMPVVGDTGSGKSHLVRWVRESIPPSENYRVIYLEKSQTSLKAVVHGLLEGVESESLSKLRADIDSFSSGLDETGLARRLINALNEALASTTPKDVSGPTRALVGPRGLAAILQDPHIQEHLLTHGRYVPQLAAHLLHNRSADSPDRSTGFTVDDLPLNVREIEKAAQVSRKLLEMLLSTPDLQTAAIDLLNQYLETAIQTVSNLGAGRLQEAMLQVREEYARQGKEIILLVEDFALIRGVQRELLDALTESATREGKMRYARMRTLMAVTTGYFHDLPETVMSRVAAATTGYVYDLDLVYSKEDADTEQIATFVGRYLNAARLGHEELERFNGQRPPNHCEACPVRTMCHDSFGQSEEGHGLYPFNRSALVRMIHSVAPADKPWAFVPRTVLGSVVRPILVEHSQEIAELSFPDPHFKERFPTGPELPALSSAVAELINTYDHIDPERRKNVLEFWGNAPSDPTDIDSGILHAFGLQPLPDEARQYKQSRPRQARTSGSPSKTTDGSFPERLQRRLGAIEDWATRNQPLPQPIANELRSIIADTVLRRYTWCSPLMKELTKGEVGLAWPNSSVVVSIEGAGGENRPGTDKAPIKFQRNTLNSQFFQSLLLAREGVEGARAEDLRRLAHLGEAKAKDLTARLQQHFEISEAELTVGFRASLIGAALAGKAWPGMDDADLLTAALDDGRTWKRGDQNLRTAQWRQLLERHLQHRKALVDRIRIGLGISQGTGAVQMIDAARALPLLRRAASDWTWSAEQPVPSWVKGAVLGFAAWNTRLEEQLTGLASTLGTIRQHLPRDISGRDSVEAVLLALKEADKVGLSPKGSGEKDRLNALISEAGKANWQVVSALERDLNKILVDDVTDAGAARVRAAARDRSESLVIIEEFLVEADRWLTYALDDAAARSDSVGDAAALEVRSVLNEWAELSGLGTDEND
ncbi:ATP-binding protein [Microbispora triticiradicis]|uniref:ATP-binding protein n=1 Tax=Microbispora triticiradicis TaxID=2200763 RepID=A0ABX9LJV1_9ACTN|nr:protein DpdH [Microbispora triticiradicis]RGA04257.1 ATP-binding protein [Microbispora triticiradicis]